MADLTRIQTAAPIQITDANSSVVALTNALPSSSAIGLVIRDAAQGQASMANSRPVVIASDQKVSRSSLVFGQYSVTTSAAAISSTSKLINVAVTIKSSNSNTSNIFVGTSGVVLSDGFELGPGEAITLPIDDVQKVYAISSTGTQSISYIGV